MNLSFERNTKLPEKLDLVPLDSELWDVYKGAFGNVVEDLRPLMNPRPRILTPPQKLQEAIQFQSLFENLWHELRFYAASYIAVPYLVFLLQQRAAERDFQSQLDIISDLGLCLSTDIPSNHDQPSLPIPDRGMIDSYNASIAVLQDITKTFLEKYLERLQWLGENEKMDFYISVLAILGDREAAFVFNSTALDDCRLACGECEYRDETIDPFSVRNPNSIRPARSVIGRWDGKSLTDVYTWFSNLVDMLGDKQAVRALAYYYGIYTCPKCGAKGRVIDLVKKYFFE